MAVGCAVGTAVGVKLGAAVGLGVGADVSPALVGGEGAREGDAVGASVRKLSTTGPVVVGHKSQFAKAPAGSPLETLEGKETQKEKECRDK